MLFRHQFSSFVFDMLSRVPFLSLVLRTQLAPSLFCRLGLSVSLGPWPSACCLPLFPFGISSLAFLLGP